MRKKLSIFCILIFSFFILAGCIRDNVINNDPNDVNPPSNQTENKPNNNNNNNVTIQNKDVRLFYYDVVNDKIVYVNKTIQVKNKAIVNALVNALKQPANNNIPPAIASEIYVKSASVNRKNNTLTVDFSENFVKAQNLGSGPEASTLQAIVNTLAYNLNVDKVILTLNGSPYSSGHILMEPSESFKVNYENTIELK